MYILASKTLFVKIFAYVCKSVYICNMAQKRYNISVDEKTMDDFIKKCKSAKEKYSNVIEKMITNDLKNGWNNI